MDPVDTDRGRVPPPILDDRRWQDLVDEARGLIPKYAPQWTDHNPSDVGMTLLELYAWMVEALIYRLNRVPERNYVAFLNLLGITRDPMTPARAFLVFTSAPALTVAVPRGKQAQTLGTETEAPVVFETDEPVTVLPTNLKVALLVGKAGVNKYSQVSGKYIVPPAEGDTIVIAPAQSAQICLGFDQTTAAALRLRIGLFRPVLVDPITGLADATVQWVFSAVGTEPSTWPVVPGIITDDTDGLQHDGFVTLTPPLNWVSQVPTAWAGTPAVSVTDQVSDPYFWIGMRVANVSAAPLRLGLRWVLFNSASSHNALTIPVPEPLGLSDGKPFQAFALRNRPLYKRPDTDTPYDHLHVEVAGVAWTQVPELNAGPGAVYRVDPVTAEINFGNYDAAAAPTGHGDIPPAGATIVAAAYRYAAGGMRGTVGAGTVALMRTNVPGLVGVTNPPASFGASDEEPIEMTKRRAPQELRNRSRAVTVEDYEFLAVEATTDVAIVRCLEPRLIDPPDPAAGQPWTFGALDRAPGNVNVIVVPQPAAAEERPDPTTDLLHEVQRFLDRRRDLTARLHVTGPRYLPINVTAHVEVFTRAIASGIIAGAGDVQLAVEQKVRAYLHPVTGKNGAGWQVGESVFIADLFKAIAPDPTVGFVSAISLLGGPPAYTPVTRPFPLAALPSAAVRLADYELACFGSHTITTSLTA
jgi:hypothetical protein